VYKRKNACIIIKKEREKERGIHSREKEDLRFSKTSNRSAVRDAK
jgi:hypothetical protein